LRSDREGPLHAEPPAADDFRRRHPARPCRRHLAGADGALEPIGEFNRQRRHTRGALPSPLWGGVGGGGRSVEMTRATTPTPLPNPPPQGGREQAVLVAALISTQASTL